MLTLNHLIKVVDMGFDNLHVDLSYEVELLDLDARLNRALRVDTPVAVDWGECAVLDLLALSVRLLQDMAIRTEDHTPGKSKCS